MSERMHPDEAVKKLAQTALELGYGLQSCTIQGMEPVGSSFPTYSYGDKSKKADVWPVRSE